MCEDVQFQITELVIFLQFWFKVFEVSLKLWLFIKINVTEPKIFSQFRRGKVTIITKILKQRKKKTKQKKLQTLSRVIM